MTEQDVYQTLSTIMQKVFNDPTMNAKPTTTAKDVRGWDSLNHIRFVLEVERAFGVKFTTSDVSKFRNVGDLVALIAQKQS
jgi:acyl carrier protein